MNLISNLEEKYKEYGEISFGSCSIDIQCLVEAVKYITPEMIINEKNMEKKRLLLLWYKRTPGSPPFISNPETEEAYAWMRKRKNITQDYDSLWGIAAFLNDTQAKGYSKDEWGELLELKLGEEAHYWLKVINNTIEPENLWVNNVQSQSILENGKKIYYLPCGNTRWETAKEAVAYTFRCTPEELDNWDFRS